MATERVLLGMLEQNVDPQVIAKGAGLSLAKILELKNGLKFDNKFFIILELQCK